MDKHTLFISDMHLSEDEPAVVQAFLLFLQKDARKADALYMLGDIFDSWIGDDNQSTFVKKITNALRALSIHTPIYIMHGNRDFLLGDDFCHAAGCTMLKDPTVIDLYDRPTLLTHGDALCLDDIHYQRLRKRVRNRYWQQVFLSLPLVVRRWIAKQLRAASEQSQTNAPQHDINKAALLSLMAHFEVELCIHGHTHKPHIHHHSDNGKTLCRIVLGDWDYHGHRLLYDEHGGLSLDTVSRRLRDRR